MAQAFIPPVQKFRSKYAPGQKGLAIDWETSGNILEKGTDQIVKNAQGLSFGAVIFDSETYEEIESVYVELQFDSEKYSWSDDAEKIHGLSREYLQKNGIPREEGLVILLELLIKHFGPNTPDILFLGVNTYYDINFTKQLFEDFGVNLPVHYVVLDLVPLAYILTGAYKSKDIIANHTGVVRGTHNALEDIQLTLQCIRDIKKIFNLGLEQL